MKKEKWRVTPDGAEGISYLFGQNSGYKLYFYNLFSK